MDVALNIKNITEQLEKLDAERARVRGMLEVFETLRKMGVTVVKPEESDINIMTTEEVVTIDGDEKETSGPECL